MYHHMIDGVAGQPGWAMGTWSGDCASNRSDVIINNQAGNACRVPEAITPSKAPPSTVACLLSSVRRSKPSKLWPDRY